MHRITTVLRKCLLSHNINVKNTPTVLFSYFRRDYTAQLNGFLDIVTRNIEWKKCLLSLLFFLSDFPSIFVMWCWTGLSVNFEFEITLKMYRICFPYQSLSFSLLCLSFLSFRRSYANDTL